MNETFKYSTILAKVVIFSLILAALMVSATKTFAQTPNEKLVLQGVRLSLWYEGAQENLEQPAEVATMQELFPEELFRALEKHDEQKRANFALRK